MPRSQASAISMPPVPDDVDFAVHRAALTHAAPLQMRVRDCGQWLMRLRAFQAVTIVLVIANWLVIASRIPAVGVIGNSIAAALTPLAELMLIIFTMLLLLAVLLNGELGLRVLKWSSAQTLPSTVWQHFFIGAPRLRTPRLHDAAHLNTRTQNRPMP